MTPAEREALDCFVTNSGLPPQDVADALTVQAAAQVVQRLLDVAHTLGLGHHPTEHWARYTHPLAPELGALFDKHGSDKASPHQYHHLYAWILGPRRYDALRVLEVGLGSNNPEVTGSMTGCARPGASLRAWRDFLPQSDIWGADVDRKALFEEERIRTCFVDQTCPASFASLPPGPYDLVVDDGLHSPHANLATLAFAWRNLAPDGWVVIEDIRATSLPIWQLAAALLETIGTARIIQADTGGRIFVAQRPAA